MGADREPLENVLDAIPEELDERVREQLRAFARDLDELVAEVDGRLVVDRDVLRRIVDSEYFPEDLRDLTWKRTEEELGDHLGEPKEAERLGWYAFCERERVPINPVPVLKLGEMGFTTSTSLEEAREIFRKQSPDFPDYIVDGEAQELREIAIRGLEHNRTVFECVRAKLGLFAAVAIFAAVGAFLIVGTATGPFGVALAVWLIAVLGFGTGTIVGNCVKDPNR
jgi:hypothetical protein